MSQEKKMLTGGDVLIKCLLEENVRYMFGIIGGQLLAIYDAVFRFGREEGIQTVMFRHEQAAAHAADAWARVTNTPGVCFGTVGPGALHLVPGVGAAWRDNIPLIVIVPQVDKAMDDSFTLQGNLDQVGLFKPVTKYQRSVLNIEKIPDAVHKAFRHAVGGRPAPVLLELYTDATFAKIEEAKIEGEIRSPENYRPTAYPSASDETVSKALKLILKAEKPLIISGGGVSRSESWNELQELAEYLQIPVITTTMGMGTMPNTSKCLVNRRACNGSDVILALGCTFADSMGRGRPPLWRDDQTLIQVDIDPTIIGRAKPITLGIISDCKEFLTKILKAAKLADKIESRSWLDALADKVQQRKNTPFKYMSDDSIPIIPQRLVNDVYEFMDEDAIVVIDGGNFARSAFRQLQLHKPRPPLSLLHAVGMGHLGVCVPYGIGAKLGKPEKQVIAMCGDGAIMMNIQDLETAVRLRLKNLIYVVGNNSSWGMLKSEQDRVSSSRYIDVDLPENINYAKIAEAMGCYGEEVIDPKDIIPALKRAQESNKPAVIDVKIEYIPIGSPKE